MVKCKEIAHYTLDEISTIDSTNVKSLDHNTRAELIKMLVSKSYKLATDSEKTIILTSLFELANSYSPSDNMLDYLEKKENSLIKSLKKKHKNDIRPMINSWVDSHPETIGHFLMLTGRAHHLIFSDNKYISKIVPNFKFTSLNPKNKDRTTLAQFTYNPLSFKDLDAHITIDPNTQYFKEDPKETLDSMHHEITHLIQAQFALGIQNKVIKPFSPFYNDALNLWQIFARNAVIPAEGELKKAYKNQTHEIMARKIGKSISERIMSI